MYIDMDTNSKSHYKFKYCLKTNFIVLILKKSLFLINNVAVSL